MRLNYAVFRVALDPGPLAAHLSALSAVQEPLLQHQGVHGALCAQTDFTQQLLGQPHALGVQPAALQTQGLIRLISARVSSIHEYRLDLMLQLAE